LVAETFAGLVLFAATIVVAAEDISCAATAAARLAELGRSVGGRLAQRMPKAAGKSERVASTTDAMSGLGYEARVVVTKNDLEIEAQNCVFHQLAMKYPEICKFDLALLSGATGQNVEHRTCMARGDSKCCFHFTPQR
jgi:predicted ArsR family transcriptional regulator